MFELMTSLLFCACLSVFVRYLLEIVEFKVHFALNVVSFGFLFFFVPLRGVGGCLYLSLINVGLGLSWLDAWRLLSVGRVFVWFGCFGFVIWEFLFDSGGRDGVSRLSLAFWDFVSLFGVFFGRF